MSWLARRRPAKQFSGIDHRVLPQLYRGSWVKAYFARQMRFVLPPDGRPMRIEGRDIGSGELFTFAGASK